jgi:hypothetical protein
MIDFQRRRGNRTGLIDSEFACRYSSRRYRLVPPRRRARIDAGLGLLLGALLFSALLFETLLFETLLFETLLLKSLLLQSCIHTARSHRLDFILRSFAQRVVYTAHIVTLSSSNARPKWS